MEKHNDNLKRSPEDKQIILHLLYNLQRGLEGGQLYCGLYEISGKWATHTQTLK